MEDGRREMEELRQELAHIDAQIAAALHRRARASKHLNRLRGDHSPSLPLADQANLGAAAAHSKGDMPEESLKDIFREIHGACLALELPAKVSFVGPEGGPGYAAVRGRFGRAPPLIAVDSTEAALDEVTRKRAQLAVVPFETSTEGPVPATLLALLASDLRIAEVIDAKFDLHLMSRGAAGHGDHGHVIEPEIEKVYATPADHARCERFLSGLPPALSVVDVATPFLACRRAVDEPSSAALATEPFGTDHGLHVVHRSVLDAGQARIRYAVVSPRPSGRTGGDKTSLVFGAQDGPGSLLDVLRVFAERGVNLTNIHSQPADGDAWRYLFYVEMAGHFTDRPLITAFEEMKRVTRFFKVLGSYPAP